MLLRIYSTILIPTSIVPFRSFLFFSVVYHSHLAEKSTKRKDKPQSCPWNNDSVPHTLYKIVLLVWKHTRWEMSKNTTLPTVLEYEGSVCLLKVLQEKKWVKWIYFLTSSDAWPCIIIITIFTKRVIKTKRNKNRLWFIFTTNSPKKLDCKA